MAMKKYGKHFILIGIVSLALGVGFGLLIKTLVSEPETAKIKIIDGPNSPQMEVK